MPAPSRVTKRRSSRRRRARYASMSLALVLLANLPIARSLHHMKRAPPRKLNRRADQTPLIIVNLCPDDIYPGIGTQSGNGPSTSGFKLSSGDQMNLTVSEDWQGRVWGRANCSFNQDGTAAANNAPGKACGSGDCNGVLNCKVGGDTPVTLAEFTLDAGDGQTYYDISLVDGYNLPMAIVLEPFGNSSIDDIPPNLTNPSCVGTVGLLAPQNWDPYTSGNQQFLGTNSSYKLPFDTKVDDSAVSQWCPWNLMANTPTAPSDGVYTYPDNSIQRPAFNPCFSACAKFNLAQDCCTGDHNSPSTCVPSEYSKASKMVCPDAYSYAFDDQTSTFIIPSGAGFQIVFCPGGRSTNILTAESSIVDSASHGDVSFGGGGNGNNADNKATRDCHGLPIAADYKLSAVGRAKKLAQRGAREEEEKLGGVSVLELKERGVHWGFTEGRVRDRKRRSSSATKSVAGELGGMTWYLMAAGLFITAGFFVML